MAGRKAGPSSGSLCSCCASPVGGRDCASTLTRGSVTVETAPVDAVTVRCNSGSRPASLKGEANVWDAPSVVGYVCCCWSALGLIAIVVAPVGVVSCGDDCTLVVVARGLCIFEIMLSNSSRSRMEKVFCIV